MATTSGVSKHTGLFAAFFCAGLALLLYTVYLIQTNQHLDMQAVALQHHWYYPKPVWAIQLVMEGGFAGTVTAVVLVMTKGLILFGAIFVLAYYGLSSISKKEPAKQVEAVAHEAASNGMNSAEIVGSEVMVLLPTYPSGEKGKLAGGLVDKKPYTQNFYRIERAVVPTKEGVVLTDYQKLYVSIYSMLKAHADVPASIGSHHADTPLFEHSLAVSKKVKAYFDERKLSEPLAGIAGLAHDLDKLLAYKKSGETWVKNVNATHHNKYAAYVVSTQPEFRVLAEDDRNTLVLALRYYHDPESLPIGTTARTETLIQALRFCDGFTVREERSSAVSTLPPETMAVIDKGLLDTISALNINNYLNSTGHAGGWTTPALEYVLSPMSTILDELSNHISTDLARKLQLDHETRTYKHPASALISERLREMGLLMTTYKGMESPNGLYDSRIGNTRFRAVVMIDKTTLEKVLPGLTDKWAASNFRVRVAGATTDLTQQDSSENDSDGGD